MDEILEILGCKGVLAFKFMGDGKIVVTSRGKWSDVDLSDFEVPANKICEAINTIFGVNNPTIIRPKN